MPEEVKEEQNIGVEAIPEAEPLMPIPPSAMIPPEGVPGRQGRDFGPGRGGSQMSDRKKFFYTKKVCKYCTRQIDEKMIDFKNIDTMKRYVMPSGKILPRRISGNCAKHQRKIVREIKKARIIALLPFLDR
jgi:small subunit ribosomal protein S18